MRGREGEGGGKRGEGGGKIGEGGGKRGGGWGKEEEEEKEKEEEKEEKEEEKEEKEEEKEEKDEEKEKEEKEEKEEEKEEKEEKGISEKASRAAKFRLLHDWLKLPEKRAEVRTRTRIGETRLIYGSLYSDRNDWNYTTSTAAADYKYRIRKDTEEADLAWLGYGSEIPRK